jgi:LemA protein
MTGFFVAVAIFATVAFLIYNSLVAKKNEVENAFASIDVYLIQRFDLIPNLVATVKGYTEHESETLTRVAEMRSRWLGATTDERVALSNQLSAGIGRLMVVAEKYPELKADAGFRNLQRALTEIEEQLAASRRAFNAAVTDFNNTVQMFPTNLAARAMGFSTRTLLITPEAERANVDVGALLKG